MTTPSIVPTDRPVYDDELLRALRGCALAREVRVLCVIGAHRFDELRMIDRVFPSLEQIYLFEPQEKPLAALHRLAAADSRLRVFPVAVSDTDGTARFNVASNNGESSSLLQLGSHRQLFPEVTMQATIEVPTRRLDSVLDEHGLRVPDMLLIDVQGAEYLVLRSIPKVLLDRVRVIYTEVSTEAVYEGAGLLPQVEELLRERFVNAGFAALRPGVPMHGNAVFIAKEDVAAALSLSPAERLRRAYHRLRRRWRTAR